jgi:hypothetical protein
MKSFGLGKKQQARAEEAKPQPPTNADLTQLLAISQKSVDRPFTLSWQTPGEPTLYILTVVTHGAQHDRRGWNSSAVDNSAIGAANWKMQSEIDGKRVQLFEMQSSDAYMVQSVIDEILAGGSEPPAVVQEPGEDAWINVAKAPAEQAGAPPSYGGAATVSATDNAGTISGVSGQALQAGNLRQTPIRTLIESYVSGRATGRLICDLGTVTSEVFFTDGEPVHAKSIHSIYNDRDMVGDNVVVDLLTWKEGDFKFQNGWPAATRTVHSSGADFLAGRVIASATAGTTTGAASSSPSARGNTSGAQSTPALPPPPMPTRSVNPDDFSNVDDLIGATFAGLVEPSGMLKYGMFLMLARTEFARHELSRVPFCVAAIGLETQGGGLNFQSMSKVLECFEAAGQPLDVISAATQSRLFVLFPHTFGAVAATSLQQFLNNLRATALENGLHGSSLRMSVGLCEVPRDGVDFESVMSRACQLRLAATPERSIVLSTG